MTSLEKSNQSQIITQVLTARENREEFLQQMKQRQKEAWKIAQSCAQILKQKFGVQRVVLFGSMLNHELISSHSDIDLAVWGLSEKDLWKAGAAIEKGHDFIIDLVEAENQKPHILNAINRGIVL